MTEREYSIRRGRERDVPALLPMMAAYYAQDGYPFDEATAGAALAALAADERLGWLWVLERTGRPAGYLAVTLGFSLEYGGRDAFVDELYLAPEARGRGLGRALLRRAERACRAAGVRALHLEVEPGRRAAQALYRKAGFVDQGRRLMTRRLTARPAAAGEDGR